MQSQECELKEEAASVLRPPPSESVASWCERCFYIPSPQTQSPGFLKFLGREFCVEPVNLFGDPTVSDVVLCFGSQIGKTTVLMGGAAWCACNDACAVLWVMPSRDLALSFSETRWKPALWASPETEKRIPTGKERHSFKNLQQILKGGATYNFIGSNSPGNLASRPARRVILDEVDKFDDGGNGEADAVNLAEQRTKSFSYPQRWKTSTPTTIEGLIWQEYLKGDQRRYFMPCPHCEKHVVFAWSKEMTVLNLTGAEAFIEWDQDARRTDGTWDFPRVAQSAHAVCPHCAGQIRDAEHKTKMARLGEWRPTSPAPASFRSYHASSLYASTPQTSFGAMAVKFLQAKNSLMGLQGFINGDLAEPFENQDTRSERTEIILHGIELETPVGDKPIRFLTGDFQFTSPHFYLVARDWTPKACRLVEAFTCNEWEEMRAHQLRLGVPDHRVAIDCKHMGEEVYSNCSKWGVRTVTQGQSRHVGWLPMQGREKTAKWTDKHTGKKTIYGFEDCPLSHKKFILRRLEFASQPALDILARLRSGKAQGFRWELTEDGATQEYFRHLDSKVRVPRAVGRTGRVTWEWEKRSERWPDHWLDCEIEQVVLSLYFRILQWGQEFSK